RNTSIGIESEHIKGQNWPTIQKIAFRSLCLYLIDRFSITQNLIAAHRWIAPNRKFDPTDWPDEELRPWIAALFAVGPYRVRHPQAIFEAPRPDAHVALNDQAEVHT